MTNDRPMSEYESALFSAVRILGEAVIKLGANEPELLSKFKEARSEANLEDRRNEAATFDLLIRMLFSSDNDGRAPSS
jgi:hypothetical protein